jgi:hypothetical protein
MAMVTRSEQTRTTAGGDGASASREWALAPPRRRVRIPELGIGVLVILVFALGGVLWHLRSVDRDPVLAVASPVERGDIITAEDLQVTYVAGDDLLAWLPPSDVERVAGLTALVDLAPGTIVTEGLVADIAGVAPGEGVVGLPLEAGQYPAFDLSAGDRVNVVRIGAAQSVEGSGSSVVARAVQVSAVEDMASADRKLVSLLAPEETADAIAAVDSGSLRLVLVSP